MSHDSEQVSMSDFKVCQHCSAIIPKGYHACVGCGRPAH